MKNRIAAVITITTGIALYFFVTYESPEYVELADGSVHEITRSSDAENVQYAERRTDIHAPDDLPPEDVFLLKLDDLYESFHQIVKTHNDAVISNEIYDIQALEYGSEHFARQVERAIEQLEDSKLKSDVRNFGTLMAIVLQDPDLENLNAAKNLIDELTSLRLHQGFTRAVDDEVVKQAEFVIRVNSSDISE
ncbi:hypothetical protein [Alkalicoccus luteus]|uniref:Uncharacterized protein n=1 Tax=Alkalicoccus luteus TaxID=1237094 RepID=A0A969PS31_9BACI|nr:hypothetical protein [Alkalicoccus luteus]NJP38338.1 hypothetical protein [Alkalicoccus luteus]